MSGDDGARCGTERNSFETPALVVDGEGQRHTFGFEVLNHATNERFRVKVDAVGRKSAWGKVLDAFDGNVQRENTNYSIRTDERDWPTLEELTSDGVQWGQE